MKRFLVFMSVSILSAAALVFSGCGKSSSGGSNASAPIVTVLGQNCIVGQIVTSDGRCLDHANCVQGSNYGWDPTVNGCVAGTLVTQSLYQQYGTDIAYGATLAITNAGVLQQMISDYTGQCTFKWLVGGPDYSYYTSSAFVDIHTQNVNSQYATVTIGAGASSPQLGMPYIPMTFSAQVFDINNSTGLSLWANGYAGTCTTTAVGANGLQVNIPSGTFTSSNMAATLMYRGQQFATAQLYFY